uniref:Very-long-chain (3R)-3-hydroxyacyl-CoA dehydratase n=1 Tax=Anabas testudineus TaxID=64144 RepID=A0A7N5ZUT4_ANATE
MALTPLVYWAQRHEEIYLRVELTDAQNIAVHVQENVLHFRAQGRGAKGQNEYEFSLELLLPVKPDEKRNRLKAMRQKEEGFVSLKTVFLFVYNLVQFLGFSWIFVNMTVRLFIFGQDSLYDTFHTISDVMFFCQILATVEVLNAAFGLVRTGVTPALIQVVGRNFILFIIFGSLEEMHHQPVVFFVFYLWSAIEIFRYPFYMLGCFNTEWKTLTWLRYTVWMPLYPLGVLAEAVAVIQSIRIFDETKLFSIPLPEAIGSSISFSYILYIYLVLMFLGLFINFRHLYKQRKRRFRTKKRKAN